MTTTIATTTAENVAQWATARGEPTWLVQQRATAWTAYQQLPLPPKTEEAWKYTDLTKVGFERLAFPSNGSGTSQGIFTVHAAAITDDLRRQGVIVADFATALRDLPELVRPYLTDPAFDQAAGMLRPGFSGLSGKDYSGAKYLSLQEALWDQGLFVYIPAGITLTSPLFSHFQSTIVNGSFFPRTIVVVEDGAQCTYVDEYSSPNADATGAALSHARVELHVKADAKLQYINIQNWHRGIVHLYHQHANVGRDSQCTSINITLGAGTTKSTVEAALTAPGATSYLFGLGFADGKQHFDHHTMQTHLAPNTTSDLLYKMALKEQTRSIYTGLIRMTKAAQKSDAYQSNRNLLLSETARANTVPQLEIEANDVRCTHGATVGTIDDEQCYYLMSRGLPRAEAARMVAEGFFEELLLRLPEESLRTLVRETIAAKLGG